MKIMKNWFPFRYNLRGGGGEEWKAAVGSRSSRTLIHQLSNWLRRSADLAGGRPLKLMAIESTEKPLLYRVHLLVNKRICTSWVAALIRWQVANETRRENTEDVLDYAGSLHAVYRVCTHTHTPPHTRWHKMETDRNRQWESQTRSQTIKRKGKKQKTRSQQTRKRGKRF